MSRNTRLHWAGDSVAYNTATNPTSIPMVITCILQAFKTRVRRSSTNRDFREVQIPKRKKGFRTIVMQPEWAKSAQHAVNSIIEGRWRPKEPINGMYRGTSIRKTVDQMCKSIKSIKAKDSNKFIISVDMKDYFDTIEWNLLWNVMNSNDILRLEGLCQEFIKVYTYKSLADIITIGNPTIRQGLTSSPIASVIVGVYVIDQAAKASMDIIGIKGDYYRYADNMYIITKSKQAQDPDKMKQLNEVLDNQIKQFVLSYNGHSETMLCVNKEKTKCYSIEEIKKHGIKVLGCSIFNNEPQVGKSFWKRTREAIHKDIRLYGRIRSNYTMGMLSRLKDIDKKRVKQLKDYIERQSFMCNIMKFRNICNTVKGGAI